MYDAGFLDTRVTLMNRADATETDYGRKAGEYASAGTAWCNFSPNKGKQSMREGMVEAYELAMIRMRWDSRVTKDTRFVIDGTTYQQVGAPIIRKRADEIQTVVQSIVE